jgi:hypothetical protein
MATLADILRQTGYSQGGTLATPTPVQSPMTKVLADHIASLPQKTAQNIEQMNWMVQNSNPYDYTGGKNPYYSYDPKAAEEFANYVPNLMGATAWHGTPHKILGKFDISKVGTGEGAQAYGHGMYFAENPAVAKEYAKDNLKYPNTALGDAQLFLRQNLFDYDAAKKDIVKNLESLEKFGKNKFGYEESKAKYQETLNLLNKGNVPKLEGNLYKVDIPDEYIPNMLHWDKPLKEQPKSVQKALAKIDPDLYSKKGGDYDPEEWGQSIYQRLSQIDMNKNGPFTGAAKNVSNLLNSYGIKGIQYLDEGSRAKGGTSNFVVFDPSTVKILEENGKALTRKELIEQQINKVIE